MPFLSAIFASNHGLAHEILKQFDRFTLNASVVLSVN